MTHCPTRNMSQPNFLLGQCWYFTPSNFYTSAQNAFILVMMSKRPQTKKKKETCWAAGWATCLTYFFMHGSYPPLTQELLPVLAIVPL